MDTKKDDITISKWWFLVFPGVIVIWLFLGNLLPLILPPPDKYKQMFEAINALFAGLAFAGIIFAIQLQRSDLKLQRHELELTREELHGQKDQLEGQKVQLKLQNDTMTLQTFENTFFQLLRLHHEIIGSMSYQGPYKTEGRECFVSLYKDLQRSYFFHSKKEQGLNSLKNACNEFFNSNKGNIGHYFANFYNIVDFVNVSEPEREEFYINLLKGQLSSHELLLLFYYCISDFSREEFIKFVSVKFNLFEDLPQEELLSKEHFAFWESELTQKE